MQITLLWNDTKGSRTIKFSVEYSIEGDTLSIFDIRPIEVTFLDFIWSTAVTRSKVRTRRVHELLRSRFLDSGQLSKLVEKIAQRHKLSVVAN